MEPHTPHFVEHASDCAQQRSKDAICNCFLSENVNLLAATSVFQPATTEGPNDVNGTFDELAMKAIQDFVKSKQPINRPPLDSSELYHPLISGEIRVLELLPASPDQVLSGRLHIVSVDFVHPLREETKWRRFTNHAVSLDTGKPVFYTTLSYVWGAPIFDHSIRFDDHIINITGSLASALRRLRSDEHSIWLWIDQLCINQKSNAEKAQQIPLMDKIYTRATNTVIWLGDDDGENPMLAFDTMERIYGRLQLSDIQITPADFARLDFPPAMDPSWLAIQRLFKRPWFSRLWTIQEAILSRELFVKCGEAVACWDDIAAWCYVLEQSTLLRWLSHGEASEPPVSSTALISGGHVMNSLQADRLQNLVLEGKEYLLNSLVRTRYAQATNPKDKVYGVLGIAESSLIPDYREETTARAVYHEACVTQLPQLVFEMLSCVDHDQPLRPSWVPDWGAARKTEALGYSTKAWTLYHAGSKSGSSQPTINRDRAVLDESAQNLTLRAIRFDRIMRLGRISEDPKLDIESPELFNTDLKSYVDLVNAWSNEHEPAYKHPYISVYDAFWQTLVAGRDSSGTVTPTQEHSEVFSLILDSTTGKMPSMPGQTYTPRRQKGFFTMKNLATRKPAKILEDLRTAMTSALRMRRFAITEKGYFSLVPRGSREGDEIVVFENACVPFVIRRATSLENMEGFELLGEAYVHGIMQGQLLQASDLVFEDLVLV